MIRMVLDMPVEHLGQRLRVVGLADDWRLRREGRKLDAAGLEVARRTLLDRLEQIGDRIHFGDGIDGKTHAEFALDAQHQFGAAERVDAEIAVEARGERYLAALQALRRELAHQFAHDRDQLELA